MSGPDTHAISKSMLTQADLDRGCCRLAGLFGGGDE